MVIGKLEEAVCNSAIWFDNNYMKLNSKKFHLSLKIGSDIITESKEEKFLGVIIVR